MTASGPYYAKRPPSFTPWLTSEERCKGCGAPPAACHEDDCWVEATINRVAEDVKARTEKDSSPYSPEVERGALWCAMETYPPSMDLPTVLWGASTALLYVRRVTAEKGSPDA